MEQKETAMTRKSRIMIYGPKADGTYEFKTAAGEALAISIPRTETAVVRYCRSRDAAPYSEPFSGSFGFAASLKNPGMAALLKSAGLKLKACRNFSR